MIAFFSVHCSKKKGGGLGLGILALAGGGGSSSSSSGDSTDKPKDDPNNDPALDPIKKKIESTIKFPTTNENQILFSNFNSVDLSITGGFFEDLGKLQKVKQKVKMEYSVSAAGSTKTIDKEEIDITQQFVTNKKIPLTLDLSSLKPATGVAQPKLKLKFSADGKQIILKEWTQNFVLKGTNQKLLFTDENDKILEEGIIFPENTTVKVKAENLPSSIQVRIESEKIDASATNFNVTNSWTAISTPTKESKEQKESTLQLNVTANFKASLVKARAFIRFKNTENWQALSETVYRAYSYTTYIPNNLYGVSVNKTILNRGDNLVVTVTKKTARLDWLRFYILDLNSNLALNASSNKIIEIIAETGDVGAFKKDNNRDLNRLPAGDAWRGISYFGDFSKNTGNVEKDYKFTLNNIKNSFILSTEFTPNDPVGTKEVYPYRIIMKP